MRSSCPTSHCSLGIEKVRSELSGQELASQWTARCTTVASEWEESQRLRTEGLVNQLNGDFSFENFFEETLPTQHCCPARF